MIYVKDICLKIILGNFSSKKNAMNPMKNAKYIFACITALACMTSLILGYQIKYI